MASFSLLFIQTNYSGVRQGVLPYLFAVWIDDLIIDIVRQSGGCTFHFVSVCIVYADDIILFAPSVAALYNGL